jgi:hypothetical protein
MRAFRQNRTSRQLALLALATQLILSFGHVHDHSGHVSLTASPNACTGQRQAPCPAQDDDHLCSICWTISIAGSLVLPGPVALDIPLLEPSAVRPPVVATGPAQTSTIQFQARAPPIAGTIS